MNLKIFCILMMLFLPVFILNAQLKGLHGDFAEIKKGIHAGNLFRITFYNDGTFGKMGNVPDDIGGEWPINSGHLYMLDGNFFVVSEVIDNDGNLKHISSTVRSADVSYSTGDKSPEGEWWTFMPLPGFANPNGNKIAMNKWPDSWPTFWPDKYDDQSDPGWAGKWNGYFGKGKTNADEESYFVADDYNKREFNFFPDSTDHNRRGLGLRVYSRGFQWSNALVEDGIFTLFDFENIGTHFHDKIAFGYRTGQNLGQTMKGYDGEDDNGAFDRDRNLAYMWDNDGIGASDWGPSPIGYFGSSFLESPGNPYDGLDNDNDGRSGTGQTVTKDMFEPKTLTLNEPIIVIDYQTFTRRKTTLAAEIARTGNDTLKIPYQDLIFKYYDGKVIQEMAHNLIDDNLNGLIDECDSESFDGYTTYLYFDENGVGYKCINYFTGEGLDNKLIDERRDDGIDNDGDWNALSDDLGADGLEHTGDAGEGDGKPTSGEMHFDKTDIDETDLLGLTSFVLFYWPEIPNYEDEIVWKNLSPGRFDDRLHNTNTVLLFGAGYFPMAPNQIERFSVVNFCGIDLDDFYMNKIMFERAYSENYNFAKAPLIPTAHAVRGNNKITLYWDNVAEQSEDPISGKDFEGYRIYRSTDPGWNDMKSITDAYGNIQHLQPIAQFDLNNEYNGLASIPIKGVHFNLGNNTGLVHSWTDTTAKNGFTYYYSITSYDHGDPIKGIPPSECSKFISINTSGTIDKGSNVVIIKPEAASLGYVTPNQDSLALKPGGMTDGNMSVHIVDPGVIRDGHKYQIIFQDSIYQYKPLTKSFSLIDLTSGTTLIDRSHNFLPEAEQPVTDGFKICFHDNPLVFDLNTTNSGWNRSDVMNYRIQAYRKSEHTAANLAGDISIMFDEVGIDSSTEWLDGTNKLPAKKVNFTILNTSVNKRLIFAFDEADVIPGEEGKFSGFTKGTKTDIITILTDSLVATYQIRLARPLASEIKTLPAAGDMLTLDYQHPFLAHDVFEFVMQGEKINHAVAVETMDNINVVPNPYIVTNSWEPHNTYSNGRGPRELHFINLPAQCTIRIFNMRGQLVQTLEHDTPDLRNGTEVWNLQTRDLLDIAYGIYIYHIEAKGIGQKIGKFAIIK